MSTQAPSTTSPGLAALGLSGESVVRDGAIGEAGSLVGGGDRPEPRARKSEIDSQSTLERVSKPLKPIRDKNAAAPAAGTERGPDGRFLPVQNPDGSADPLFEAKTDALDAQPEDAPEGEQPEAEESGEKFMFGGVEFESREKAEQAFKTQRGMHKAMMTREADAIKNRDDWKGAYDQIRPEYDRLLAHLESIQGNGAEETRAPGDGNVLKGDVFVEALGKEGWNTFQAEYAKNPTMAFAWLVDNMQQFSDARVEAKIEAALAKLQDRYDSDLEPVRETQAQRKALGNVTEFFYAQANAVDDTGQYLYPEFRERDGVDPKEEAARMGQVLEQFMPIWKELVEASPQTWHSPAFFKAAYRAYKADLNSGAIGRGESPETDALLSSVRNRAGASGRAIVDGGAPLRPASGSVRDTKAAFVKELVGARDQSPFGNWKR